MTVFSFLEFYKSFIVLRMPNVILRNHRSCLRDWFLAKNQKNALWRQSFTAVNLGRETLRPEITSKFVPSVCALALDTSLLLSKGARDDTNLDRILSSSLQHRRVLQKVKIASHPRQWPSIVVQTVVTWIKFCDVITLLHCDGDKFTLAKFSVWFGKVQEKIPIATLNDHRENKFRIYFLCCEEKKWRGGVRIPTFQAGEEIVHP